jgi:23S rRNA pseudouridine1911/1915/1917 synthase
MTEANRVRVAHKDDWLAVIDKPAGLVVHPAPGASGRTLVDVLGEMLGGGDPERPGIVHRLDADTSGLMVVARSDAAHARLSEMVRGRELEREYVALVEGHLSSRTGTIDAPIGRHHRAPERMAVSGRAAREARTHFEVLELLPGATLVRVRLETGRTHQIRTHFAAIGHPLVGDDRYGSSGRYGLDRQFLHSRRIAFTHPFTGARLEFNSDLPPDLSAALGRAREG